MARCSRAIDLYLFFFTYVELKIEVQRHINDISERGETT
jgi:hypothetical protein